MNIMKKYFSSLLIAMTAFFSVFTLQAQQSKVIETISVFPYQHKADADAALTTIGAWKKSDWKGALKLMVDDSLKVKAADAIHAYANLSSLDADKKMQLLAYLNKGMKSAKTDYAKEFIQSQLNLLSDESVINQANAGLPKLPAYQAPAASTLNDEQSLLQLQDEMELVKNPVDKKNILSKAAHINSFSSFMFVSKSLQDEEVNKYAALVVTRLALADPNIKGPIVRDALESAMPLIHGEDSAVLVSKLKPHLLRMPYDYGFVNLFNGRDLTGWKALVGNPISRSKMTDTTLARVQAEADAKMMKDQDWIVKDGLLIFTGHGDNLTTVKKYGDIEMYVDWKITEKGDAGIYLRGTPQVQIWDTSRRDVGAQVGSGGLYNNQKYQSKPLVVADNKIGEWNRFHIIMKGEKVTVYLNGILVTDNIPLENYWDHSIPIFSKEQIELQAHGTYVAYRNIYLREIPSTEPTVLDEAEKKQGFVSLFDGTNIDQWTGNTAGYLVKDGVVEVSPNDGSVGNLYTKEEFSNFIYRFEFQLTPGANNGIGIRAPLDGDAAYVGMEIQVLDSEHPMYKDLHVYQYHGSVYGVIPAKRGYLLPTGQWNKEEIIAKGNKIKVTLNGTVILDGDIKEASKNGTMDHKEHPGLLRTTGHLGFLGHGDVVRFRNMRVKKL
jgi:hypothetical protein